MCEIDPHRRDGFRGVPLDTRAQAIKMLAKNALALRRTIDTPVARVAPIGARTTPWAADTCARAPLAGVVGGSVGTPGDTHSLGNHEFNEMN